MLFYRLDVALKFRTAIRPTHTTLTFLSVQCICHAHSFSDTSSTRNKFLRFSLKTLLVYASILFLVFFHSTQNKIGQANDLLHTEQYAIPKAIWNSATLNASITSDSLHQANLLYSWPNTKHRNPKTSFTISLCTSWLGVLGQQNLAQHTMSVATKNFKTQRLNRRDINATIITLNKHSSHYIMQIVTIIITII